MFWRHGRRLLWLCLFAVLCLLLIIKREFLEHGRQVKPWEASKSFSPNSPATKITQRAGGRPPQPKESLEKTARPASNSTSTSKRSKKFAYVFYITNEIYTCYALANAERMVVKLNMDKHIDIVLITMHGTPVEKFCTEKCFGKQVKIKRVPVPPRLTDTERYVHCYVRFEAFRLLQYDRIVILDADGVVVQNLDHLFEHLEEPQLQLNLEGHSLAAGYTPNTERWLDSVLLVVEPSQAVYDSVAVYLNRENISRVAEFARGAHYDMDLLNLVFQRGLRAKILSKWYVMHDHQFNEGKVEKADIRQTFYVHYTSEKPFAIWQEKMWYQTQGFITSLAGGFLYRSLWDEYDKHCGHMKVQKKVTLPVIEKDRGFYYPDPQEILQYLQNNTDYLVMQKNRDKSSED